MERRTVYSAYDLTPVFRGTFAECEAWILEQAPLYGGRKIFRTWTEGTRTFYDVEKVFYIDED